MNDKFLMGVILGMLGGAIVTANSKKAQQLVKDSEQQVKEKIGQAVKKK